MVIDFLKGLTVFTATFLMTLVAVKANGCSLPSPGTELEVQHVLKHHILHEVYPRCHSVDFSRQHPVCEIWDATDETAFICMGRPGCPDSYSHWTHMPSHCSDGTLKKTCVASAGDNFLCACHSARQEPVCATQYRWDSEWTDFDGGEQGLYRKLCDLETLSCPVTEYRFGVAHLVKYTQLPDDKITASSNYDSNFPSEYVRIDNYFTICCWTAAESDPEKWVQFDLLETFTGFGALLRERCVYEWGQQRPTKVDISYSLDGSVWEWAATDVIPVYGETVSSTFISYTHWFEQPHSGRYWRIYIRQWLIFPSMKADIIGEVHV